METQPTDTSQAFPQPLSDAAWKSVLPFLKAFPNIYVGNPETCRRFLSETVVWMTKEGASWRALPKVYGYWNTIYRRFSRWCDAGVFEALHEHFHDAGELSALLVDSTLEFYITPFHKCGAINIRQKYLGCLGDPVVEAMAPPVGFRLEVRCCSA